MGENHAFHPAPAQHSGRTKRYRRPAQTVLFPVGVYAHCICDCLFKEFARNHKLDYGGVKYLELVAFVTNMSY